MSRLFLLCLLLCISLMGQAQHPFYMNQLSDARNAMENKANWELAGRLLEIAAFGLLEDDSALGEIFIRLAIVQQELGHESKYFEYLSRAKRLVPDVSAKPAALEEKYWNRFSVLAGYTKPPVPKTEADLDAYLKTYPDNVSAWKAMIALLQKGRDQKKLKDLLGQALEKFPKDKDLLEQGLRFSLLEDRGRLASVYSERLQAEDPTNGLLHEYLGNNAFDSGKMEEAVVHYAMVTNDELPKTEANRARALAAVKQKLKDEMERQKKEKASQARADENQRDRDKTLKARNQAEKAEKTPSSRKTEPETSKNSSKKETAAKTEPGKETVLKPGPKKETASRSASGDGEKHPLLGKADEKKGSEAKKPVTRQKEPSLAEKLAQTEKAARKAPANKDLQFDLVQLYLDSRNLSKAKKLLKKLGDSESSKDPRYADAFGRYNFLKGDFSVNVDVLGGLTSLSPDARYFLGMSYYRLQQWQLARDTLADLPRSDYPDLAPADAIINTNLSKARDEEPPLEKKKESEDPPARLNQLEAKVKNNLASADDRVELIGLYVEANNWKAGRKLIRKTAEDYPQNSDASYWLGRLHLEERRYQEAGTLFNNLANANYRKGEVLYYGGLAALRQGDRAVAAYMFDKALQEGTRFTAEIAQIQQNDRKSPAALNSKQIRQKIADLEKVAETYSFIDPQISLLRLYLISGNQKEFKKMYQTLKTMNLNGEQQDLLQAWDLTNNGELDKAAALVDRHRSDESLFLQAYLLQQQGQKDRASQLFKKIKDTERFPELALLSKR